MPPRGNIRDQIPGNDRNRETTTSTEIATLDKRIKQGNGYYAAVSPTHVSGDYFVAMALGYLHRNPKLAAAAVRNPGSFLAALGECARDGLVLGETYHCVPFWNDETKRQDIVGIRDYKGEIELMYRSGGVKTVVYDVIRERDYFKRSRTPSEEPEFAPLDEGLAPESERGELRGVFAYAILDTGAMSHLVVMGKDEVMKHRDKARTKTVWDGPFRQSQWIKSAIKELRKGVPSSPEYRREQMRALAAHENTAPQELAAVGATLASSETGEIEVPPLAIQESAGTLDGNGLVEDRKDEKPPRKTRQRKGSKNPDDRPETVSQLFDEIGVEEAERRYEVVRAILGPDWDGRAILSEADDENVRDALRACLAAAEAGGSTARERLDRTVERLLEADRAGSAGEGKPDVPDDPGAEPTGGDS